jgi:hypothetical protein
VEQTIDEVIRKQRQRKDRVRGFAWRLIQERLREGLLPKDLIALHHPGIVPVKGFAFVGLGTASFRIDITGDVVTTAARFGV